MINIKLNIDKPNSCIECPFHSAKYTFYTCLLLQKTKEDNGKNFLFRCPIKTIKGGKT